MSISLLVTFYEFIQAIVVLNGFRMAVTDLWKWAYLPKDDCDSQTNSCDRSNS